jgi:hypothetical protein
MQITYASEASDADHSNEDLVIAGTNFVLVLDGATAPSSIPSGCVHDVSWLVRHLGGRLALLLTLDQTNATLADQLAEAIQWTCTQHADTCDLGNPASPSSTAAIFRVNDKSAEALVLSDSPIVLDLATGIQHIRDDRTDRLPSYLPEDVRDQRNQPGGFWVASTNPEAAYQAVNVTVPREEVRRAAVLTDGAARLVERFHLTDWPGLLRILDTYGPADLIHRVRVAERTIEPALGSRGKRHDDATAALANLARERSETHHRREASVAASTPSD